MRHFTACAAKPVTRESAEHLPLVHEAAPAGEVDTTTTTALPACRQALPTWATRARARAG